MRLARRTLLHAFPAPAVLCNPLPDCLPVWLFDKQQLCLICRPRFRHWEWQQHPPVCCLLSPLYLVCTRLCAPSTTALAPAKVSPPPAHSAHPKYHLQIITTKISLVNNTRRCRQERQLKVSLLQQPCVHVYIPS